MWTPSVLPPGSILLTSLSRVLWQQHQTHYLRCTWYEITLFLLPLTWTPPVLHSSLRRGGASYAFKYGTPVELIILQGDSLSDTVLLYIARSLERCLSVARLIALNVACHAYFFSRPLHLFLNIPFLSGSLGRSDRLGVHLQLSPPLDVALLFLASNKGY